MRARPDLSLFLRPGRGVPGQRVAVELIARSKSLTPIKSIELSLRGIEQVIVQVGQSSSSYDHQHVGLAARFDPKKLTPGEHRFTATFDLPRNAPGTYRSSGASIDYVFEALVRIPWWLDRRERFTLPVAFVDAESGPSGPQIFCTSSTGPKGDALYIEASLDDASLAPGATLTGAVSFSNVSRTRVRAVDLVFVATEVVSWGGGRGFFSPGAQSREGKRLASRILDRAPTEGETVPFRVRLPEDVAPSFRAQNLAVRWDVLFVAEVAWGNDVQLKVPVVILPAALGPSRRERLGAPPPVGRERRALVWNAVAQKQGLVNDAQREEMTETFGPASLTVRLEHRDGEGFYVIADVSWPSIKRSLEVRERKWLDALRSEAIPIAERKFADRFHVTGQDEGLLAGMFEERLCNALLAFEEVRVDDEGATLALRASVQSAETLMQAIEPTVLAARALGDAIAKLPGTEAGPYR